MWPILYRLSSDGALRQGEILADVIQSRLNVDSVRQGGALLADLVTHPYAVVLSQDCDLEQDYKRRQAGGSPTAELPAVLLCEAFAAVELEAKLAPGSETRKRFRQNKDERYHYLRAVPASVDLRGVELPDLGIDFKRYFSIPTGELYLRLERQETLRRTRLETPYAEHLSARFACYFSRIALPEDHFLPNPSGN